MPANALIHRSTSVPGPAAVGAASLVLVAAVFVAQAVLLAATTHSRLPQLDEWYSLGVYRDLLTAGGFFERMFAQHNEHRIFFPRFVLFADYRYFGGSGYFDLAAIFLIQGLQAVLFIILLRRCGIRGSAAAGLGALATILLFSLRQSENFVWGFQVQFVGVFAAASWAVTAFAFALSPERTGPRKLALLSASFLLVIVASFSMTNGLLGGIVLLCVGLLARAPVRILVGTALLAAAIFAVFLHGYQIGPDHQSFDTMLRNPVPVMAYTAAYLGNIYDNQMSRALTLGTGGLLGFVLIVASAALSRRTRPAELALIGIAAFTAGSAFVTALGRSIDGLGGAMASRYATGAVSFWAAVLICAWSMAQRARFRVPIRGLVAATAVLCLMPVFKDQPFAVSVQQDRRFKYNVVEDALLQGLYDDVDLARIDENSDLVRDLTPFLRERGLSVFASRDARLFGRPLGEAGPVAEEPCPGTIVAALGDPALGQDGATLRGEAPVRHYFAASSRIYIANGARTIVGFGSTPFGRNDWAGYATAPLGSDLSAYAVVKRGELCRIGMRTVEPKPADP